MTSSPGESLDGHLLPNDGGDRVALRRQSLTSIPGGYDEKWLQRLLLENPQLVLLDRMDPGAGAFVPLHRELPLARDGGLVFLDLLGIARSGRLVLIECKLWRNPQARREVVAQILEYAGLLRGLNFGDLTAKLRSSGGPISTNPIFDRARTVWPDIEEGPFVDAVTRSLKSGDFHLVIAGDGIRSDLHSISDHLNMSGLAAARLALLEIQVWADSNG